MAIDDICTILAKMIQSRSTSTVYLNGPPGSGRSHLLIQLSEMVPKQVPRSQVLGPYQVSGMAGSELGKRILSDCQARAYIDSIPKSIGYGLSESWTWFLHNADLAANETFVILIDVDSDVSIKHLPSLADMFSQARYLEGLYGKSEVRTLILVAGYWLGTELEAYYHQISTSFPFTSGHNDINWQGVRAQDMTQFSPSVPSEQSRSMIMDLLFELTGGHPEVVKTIIGLCNSEVTVAKCIESTKSAAKDSEIQRRFISVWKQLPAESLAYLPKLILSRRLPSNIFQNHKEPLISAGIIEEIADGRERRLKFRSWFIELVIHLHAQELNLPEERLKNIDPFSLIPDIASFSMDAYRLINEIENSTRNFLTIQLSLICQGRQDILSGKLLKYDSNRGEYTDAQSRALEWQSRSTKNGLPTLLNPLIAYLSTRDLADMFDEFSRQNEKVGFKEIGRLLRDLSNVRDAIMHNQLIDEFAIG